MKIMRNCDKPTVTKKVTVTMHTVRNCDELTVTKKVTGKHVQSKHAIIQREWAQRDKGYKYTI